MATASHIPVQNPGFEPQPRSMFTTALPYGLGSLGVAGVGVAIALTAGAAATAGLVAGIALAIIGAYAFYGVIATAIVSANANEFQSKVWKGIGTAAGLGLSSTIEFIAKILIIELISSLFKRR